MRTITLRRRHLRGFGLTESFWGEGAVMICSIGLQRHTDVRSDATDIEIVAVKTADESNDYFDVRKSGTLEGVGEIDCDFATWLRRGYALGYRYVYVNELS